MRALQILLYVISAVAIFLGFMFLIASVYAASRILVGLAFLFGGGLCILWANKMGRGAVERRKLESAVLSLAKDRGGKLTVAEVSAELGIPVDLAKQVLSSLEREGLAYLDFEEIDREGIDVYKFPGVLEED